MDHATLVSRLQCIDNLQRDTSGDVRQHRPLQRHAIHVLEHEVVRAEVVDLTDVGMVQRGDCASFLVEPVHAIRVIRKRLGQDLDGNLAVQPGVARPVHFAHTTCTKRGGDLVGTESSTSLQGHIEGCDYRRWYRYGPLYSLNFPYNLTYT